MNKRTLFVLFLLAGLLAACTTTVNQSDAPPCPSCDPKEIVTELVSNTDPVNADIGSLDFEGDCWYCACGMELSPLVCLEKCKTEGPNENHPCYGLSSEDPCDPSGGSVGNGSDDPPDPCDSTVIRILYTNENTFISSTTRKFKDAQGNYLDLEVTVLDHLPQAVLDQIEADDTPNDNSKAVTYFNEANERYYTLVPARGGQIISFSYSSPEVLAAFGPKIIRGLEKE